MVGVGHLGSYHLDKYLAHPEVASVVIYDRDPAAAARALERAGGSDIPVRAADSLAECLAGSEAVSIAVPTAEHLSVARTALDACCHLLIEKPLADTAGGARQIAEQAAACDRIVHTGHVERFNPALEGLDTAALSPGFIEAHRLAPWNPRGTDVGVVHDLMVHDLDLILHLTGESPTNVVASGVGVITPGPDIANARLTFPGGCVANITASRVSLTAMRKLRIFQPSTYLSLDLQSGVRETIRLRNAAGGVGSGSDGAPEAGAGEEPVLTLDDRVITRSEEHGERDALAVEIDAFLRSVEARAAGTEPAPPAGVGPAEAVAALELAEEITRLIAAG